MPIGLPPTEKALDAYLEMMQGCDIPWGVSAVGGDVVESGIAELALERGGHIHVGLEMFAAERQPTNVELVAEVVDLCQKVGREPLRWEDCASYLDLSVGVESREREDRRWYERNSDQGACHKLGYRRVRLQRAPTRAADGVGEGDGIEDPELDRWGINSDQGQLTRLAKVLRRPVAVFYRSEPPQSDSKLLQLRTGRGAKNRSLTPDERFQVREARRRQRWISELLSDDPLVDIPSFNSDVSATTAAARLRQWCEVDAEQMARWDSDHDGYLAWKRALESRGVLVMELQLGQDGMRGFSLADPYAPAVAVNTIENAAARSFTLWHEVAHLARSDTSSVSSWTN